MQADDALVIINELNRGTSGEAERSYAVAAYPGVALPTSPEGEPRDILAIPLVGPGVMASGDGSGWKRAASLVE